MHPRQADILEDCARRVRDVADMLSNPVEQRALSFIADQLDQATTSYPLGIIGVASIQRMVQEKFDTEVKR